MMTRVCNGPRNHEYLDHSWYLRKGIRVEGIGEGVNSSKNEGQMLNVRLIYFTVLSRNRVVFRF